MAMESKWEGKKVVGGPAPRAQRPVNALDAAKRAAHAAPEERDRLRAAAAGTRRAASCDARPRSPRVLSLTAALIGIALAVVVVYLLAGALTGVAHHRDGAAASEAELAMGRPSDGIVGKSLEYGGYVYRLSTTADGCVLQRYAQGAEDAANDLCKMNGTPVGIVEHAGAVYAISTTDTSYCVTSLALGDGCVPVEFAQGDGSVQAAKLADGTLKLEFGDGATKSIEFGV